MPEPQRRFQFGVRFMLGWMAAVAVALAAGRFVLACADWSLEVIRSEFFLFGAAVGVYNALFAFLAVGSVGWGRRWDRLLLQAALTRGAGWSRRIYPGCRAAGLVRYPW